jgi:hypothetical protein
LISEQERIVESTFESSVSAMFKKVGVGGVLQAAGIILFSIGAAQLFHHGAIAACVVGGAATFLVGKKLRPAN